MSEKILNVNEIDIPFIQKTERTNDLVQIEKLFRQYPQESEQGKK